MFTIDLLKDRGVPIKSKPGGTFLVAVSFIVPVAMAAVVLGNYLHDRILIVHNRNATAKLEYEIEDLTSQLELRKLSIQQRDKINSCYNELAGFLRQYIQWTGVLRLLVENIHEKMALEKLEAMTAEKSVDVAIKSTAAQTKKDSSGKVSLSEIGDMSKSSVKKTKKILKIERSLRVGLSVKLQDDIDGDDLLRNLIFELENSNLPRGKIGEANPGPSGTIDDIVNYSITCLFATNES
ncbi:MAG: hypothetical protein E4H40_01830 [Candidatus Brocadiia bacterium]|nr:MAG: hypothetical protein E4H40_01830 [Candidatus Brocadiia bacterium]